MADAVKLPVLNIGAPEDSLRQQDCRPRLYHVLPSERMRADAIAQTLVSRKWSKLLLLVGPSPKDQQRAATACTTGTPMRCSNRSTTLSEGHLLPCRYMTWPPGWRRKMSTIMSIICWSVSSPTSHAE